MEIEPAKPIGHYVEGEDADRELVARAQPIGDRAVEIARAEAQFVGQRFGLRVEIGEMVAPARDLAPDGGEAVGLRTALGGGAGSVQPIKSAGKGLGGARGGGKPFLHLGPVDFEIGKERIGEAAANGLRAAAGFIGGKRARIEIELLGEAEQQRGRKRALVAFDQVQIAGGDVEHLGHRHLGDADAAPETFDRMSCEKLLLCHGRGFCQKSYNVTNENRHFAHAGTRILSGIARKSGVWLSIFFQGQAALFGHHGSGSRLRKTRTMSYQEEITQLNRLIESKGEAWNAIGAEAAARMRLQNRFRTGLDIARYTAKIMRQDMAAYDADPANYTQSLGCWHGFIAQQKMISIKKHFGTTKRKYLYLSGWMVAALRSEFGPLPDQSMHEKTSVPALIEELYTFLRQADSRELNLLFRELDAAREQGDAAKEKDVLDRIENFETHVVPVIADIDAGFGNAEATYLLAKKMIEAGACALQIENQVSDEKQCGHQDGKVTVPHEDFLQKVRACRYAFLELGIEDGIIVTRTDSLGAGLTKQIAVSKAPGDLGDQYNSFLDCEEIDPSQVGNGDVVITRNGKLMRPKRLPSNLFQFRPGTGEDRCVLDSIASLQNGADLLWIETEKPHIEQIAGMMDRIRDVVPNAKLVYNNSPSFNWTLNFRQQVFDAWEKEGRDVSAYDRTRLMSADYDDSELSGEADERIRTFQRDAAKRAGIFHHLITLPTYHTAALSTDNLAKEYFGEQGMLGYVAGVQRKEIRQGIACVKHQNMSGSDIGDDHKEYFAGEAALKAGGKDNTMNQFSQAA